MKTDIPPIPGEPSFPVERKARKVSGVRDKKRFSPLGLIGIGVTLVVVLATGVYFVVLPRLFSHAAGAQTNMNCSLIVPTNPLSAKGLATPYQLVATDPNAGPCNEANADQSAFVQGVIYDPRSGTFSVYSPLVIDKGAHPAVTPTTPMLPRGAVVGLWFGFNATNLQLVGAQKGTLQGANCVNGQGQSLFGQFAYCNAPQFFESANRGLKDHKFRIPALKKANDGLTCPTVRDFGIVDQDQSDNVQTEYLSTADGRVAQFSAANMAALPGATVVANPSDNALLTTFIDPALGCSSWQAPDLANRGQLVSALPLDEMQAAADQQGPVALVPLTDPMTMIAQGNNNVTSLTKTNLYRRGVDQRQTASTWQAGGAMYCQNLLLTGGSRLVLDKPLTINATSPDTGAANSLFTFLAMRLQGSYDNLNCAQLLNIPNPVTTQTDSDGVVISAAFNAQIIAAATQTAVVTAGQTPVATSTQAAVPTPAPTTSAVTPTQPTPVATATPASSQQGQTLSCSVNGQIVQNCSGSATVNGQTCQLTFTNNVVNFVCPQP